MRYLLTIMMTVTWTMSIAQAVDQKEKLKQRRIKIFTRWIHNNNIKLKQLPKADPREVVYDCDSLPGLRQIRGDTLIYWVRTSWSITGGIYPGRDLRSLNDLSKQTSFGQTDYVQGFNDDGNLIVVSLRPKKFQIRNDSLYEFQSFFTIPYDSIDKAMDEKKFELATTLMRENVDYKFHLIFHPDLFLENKGFIPKNEYDSITLDHIWNVSNRRYYQITFHKNLYGQVIAFPTYLFDDQYRFILYEGCNTKETALLRPENEILIR